MLRRNFRPFSSGWKCFDLEDGGSRFFRGILGLFRQDGNALILKMEVAGSSETLITSYLSLRYHKPEDLENIEFEIFN